MNQEPGEILNNIQRCSAKFLQLYDEKECCDIHTNLKLFSAFIYFSSPIQRSKFHQDVEKYLDRCDSIDSLFILKKILTYIKISDKIICERFWSLSLTFLNDDNIGDIVRLCHNYISFNTDVPNFRHFMFEKKIFQCIECALKKEELIFSPGLVMFLNFSLKYQANETLLNRLVDKLENNVFHIQPLHYLQLSDALNGITRGQVSNNIKYRIRGVLNKAFTKLVESENNNIWNILILAKAMTVQNDMDNYTFAYLLYSLKEMDCMTSKFLEIICTIFLTSSSIVPEVLNKCTHYILNNPDNIVGFNAEKILFLCFFLAYYPLNADKLFTVVTDIILR